MSSQYILIRATGISAGGDVKPQAGRDVIAGMSDCCRRDEGKNESPGCPISGGGDRTKLGGVDGHVSTSLFALVFSPALVNILIRGASALCLNRLLSVCPRPLLMASKSGPYTHRYWQT